MTHLSFVAYGIPGPQGSKRHVGHGVMVESSKKVEPWRESVKMAALQARLAAHLAPIDGPVWVRMVFTLAKPQSAPKTRRSYPCRTPDLSKLARSTEDAMTFAGIWKDDARVVEYIRLAKVFPREDPEALDTPGATVFVTTEPPAGTRWIMPPRARSMTGKQLFVCSECGDTQVYPAETCAAGCRA